VKDLCRKHGFSDGSYYLVTAPEENFVGERRRCQGAGRPVPPAV